jgi:diacylglycerol kinase family enzyme
VVERGYDTVFVGGGDRTFSRFVTALLRAPRPVGRRLPRLGILPLGTGGALAALVKASPLNGGPLDDVLRARAGEVPGYRRLDLLDVDGTLAPYAGMGLDAQLHHDRAWMRERLGRTPLRRLVQGAGGLASTAALHSLSALARSPEVECEVRCWQGGALPLGPEGEPAGPFLAPGTVLFKGPARLAAASALPRSDVGWNLPLLAGRERGRMHLRVGASSGVLPEVTRLWRGAGAHGRSQAFLASEVTLTFARPMPVQVGGGVAEPRDALHLRLLPEAVELCDFSGSVH